MKKLLLFGILVVNASFFAFNANAQFASGTGTVADPYLISTASQLNNVRNYLTSSFKLGNDIDLTDWITANSPTNGWNPIGTATNYFSGNFDGDGHFITGLWIDLPTTDNVGLFGVVAGGGTIVIKNLGVKIPDDKYIAGGWDVAGIVGYLANTTATTILNLSSCFVSGTISGTKNVGGIIGYSYYSKPTLQNCYATGSVTSSGDGAGGLFGSTYGTATIVIDKCYSVNSVAASDAGSAGGILGAASASTGSNVNLTISNCVVINPQITAKSGTTYRIFSYSKSGAIVSLINNFSFDGVLINGATVTGGIATDKNGLNKTKLELTTQSTYNSWDFSIVWQLANGNYPLPVLKVLGMTKQPSTLPIPFGGATGISDILGSKIKVYYNYKSGNILVEGKSLGTPVSIYDCHGSLMLKSQESNLNISNFSKGIYLVNISGYTTKILK